MLTDYVRAAMRGARYEILSDDGSFYGEIPGFAGVYANAETLEACRELLQEVLEAWMQFRTSIERAQWHGPSVSSCCEHPAAGERDHRSSL